MTLLKETIAFICLMLVILSMLILPEPDHPVFSGATEQELADSQSILDRGK